MLVFLTHYNKFIMGGEYRKSCDYVEKNVKECFPKYFPEVI